MTDKTTAKEFSPEYWQERLEAFNLGELDLVKRCIVLLPALRQEPDNEAAQFFHAAMKAEAEAGTITADRMNGYLSAIEATLQNHITAQTILNGEPLKCEEVQQLMQERLADPETFAAGLYGLIYYAQQAQGNKIADLVNAAFIAGIRSGEIQTGEQAQPYLDALAKILDLPDEADGALSQIRAGLRTLETVLDRHFEETLPRLEEAAPEEWEKVQRDIDATQDIYNVYIDHIREIFKEADEKRPQPYK